MHPGSELYRHRLPSLEHGRWSPRPAGSTSVDPLAGRHAAMPSDGRVHPQTVTTGLPSAAAKCIMPVSAARTARAPRINAADSAIDVCPAQDSAL